MSEQNNNSGEHQHLHNEDGTLNKIGFFKHMDFPYERERVHANALRIKE